MVSTSSYSSSSAKALLATTKHAERVKPTRPNHPAVVTSADLALMERELKDVHRSLSDVEASYGRDMVDPVIAARYVLRLLGRRRIAQYLEDNHPEMTEEFRAIVSATLPDDARESDHRKDLQSQSRARPADAGSWANRESSRRTDERLECSQTDGLQS
jgi:hypothetical protein